MITVTICNHKGGTGKTTSAMHVAAALGLSGHRTLVVDLDPQGFLTNMLGIGEPARAASSLVLFEPEAALDAVPVERAKGFDVLPASSALTKRMRSLGKPTDVLWAKETLQNAALGYDVVLFDTAAAVTVYSLNALVASQFVVIPVTPEYQPVLGAEQTYQTVGMVRKRLNPSLEPPLFLFTQVDGRKRAHHRYRNYLREKYRGRVMDTIIRTSAALSTSRMDGTTVFDHHPRARGAHDYANATDELLERFAGRYVPTQVPAAGEQKAMPEALSVPPKPATGAPNEPAQADEPALSNDQAHDEPARADAARADAAEQKNGTAAARHVPSAPLAPAGQEQRAAVRERLGGLANP